MTYKGQHETNQDAITHVILDFTYSTKQHEKLEKLSKEEDSTREPTKNKIRKFTKLCSNKNNWDTGCIVPQFRNPLKEHKDNS